MPAAPQKETLEREEQQPIRAAVNRPYPEGKSEFPLTGGDGQWSEVPVSNHRNELSAAFSLANTSVHSTFSSNGAILLFLLLMLMPRTVRAAPAPSVPRGAVNLVSAEERPTSQQ